MYQDPTLTIGPSIVKGLVSHFMDGFSGAKIAGQAAVSGLAAHNVQAESKLAADVARQYAAWLQSNGHDSQTAAPRMAVIAPGGQDQVAYQGMGLIGPMMAGMIVLFAFFIGANGAESLIREDEEGTLKRLFTTPTGQAAIIGGKFVSIIVSLCIQVALLLLASTLLFGIRWGHPATVAIVAAGLIVAAAGFGVMLMSFIKSTRQTGPVMGGVMTLTGLLGGLLTTGIPNVPASFDRFTLIVPQGWALQGWKLALSGAGPGQALVTVLVLCLMGVGFLAVGAALFRRRFA
jgi:ABC-2 type transport system permease protein